LGQGKFQDSYEKAVEVLLEGLNGRTISCISAGTSYSIAIVGIPFPPLLFSLPPFLSLPSPLYKKLLYGKFQSSYEMALEELEARTISLASAGAYCHFRLSIPLSHYPLFLIILTLFPTSLSPKKLMRDKRRQRNQ
jgi:hypothetical protein